MHTVIIHTAHPQTWSSLHIVGTIYLKMSNLDEVPFLGFGNVVRVIQKKSKNKKTQQSGDY